MNMRTWLAVAVVVLIALAVCIVIVVMNLIGRGPPSPDRDMIEANNRAVGLMGQYKYNDAREIFAELTRKQPDWIAAKVNLAIATFNRQEEGDEAAALQILREVLEEDPDNVRALFCAALLLRRTGLPENIQRANEYYRQVAEADPDDAYAAYRVAESHRYQDNFEQAVTWYRRAIELDPYLRSAYYGASQVLTRRGRNAEAAQLQDEFQRLENNPRAKIVTPIYNKLGPKALTVAIGDDAEDVTKKSPPEGPLFGDPRPLIANGRAVQWTSDQRDRPVSITAADMNEDGLIDIFIADSIEQSDDVHNAVVYQTSPGEFEMVFDHPLARIDKVNAAVWGDYDNDGRTDVYLCRDGPNQLWRKSDSWVNVTEPTATANNDFSTVDGAMFDADHDGDLDIFCVNVDGPNELLNNNLDGTFQPIAKEAGLTGNSRASKRVLVADLQRDRDADIIVINEKPPHNVYYNHLLWEYKPAQDAGEFIDSSSIQAAATADTDADGLVEIYTIGGISNQLQRWIPNGNGSWRSEQLPVQAPEAEQLLTTDVSGSGVPDLLMSESERWGLLNLQDPDAELKHYVAGRNNEVSDRTLLGMATVAIRPSHGPAVVTLPAGGEPMLWPAGSGRHAFTAINFSGQKDPTVSMRSNASGIGVHYAARVDSQWITGDTYPHHSTPGQSMQPTMIGINGHEHLDFIEVDWPDGVFQSEVHGEAYQGDGEPRDLSSGHVELINEIQRQVSSCPVLFVWNGEKYEFVSDLLGVGGIGYMVAPGEYAPPRPWENFLLPQGMLQPKDDSYVLKLTEPMEEACYLDLAGLIAYDLPPGWQMTLDERMNIAGPESTGEPRFYRNVVLPMKADSSRFAAEGKSVVDVTRLVTIVDQHAAPVGELDHRFIGRLEFEHILTLTFDQPLDDHSGKPMLIADGWVEYPYSQTMFAAWQANADYRAPTIEAGSETSAGHIQWTTIHSQFGYPAGMPRQMSLPLGDLPDNTRYLRLSTNQEIYWDRLAVAWSEPCEDVRTHRLDMKKSEVASRGFPKRTTGSQRLPHYEYHNRSPVWDTEHQRGRYTSLGPATELLTNADDALAIFGPGEEVHVEFDAKLPSLPSGWSRRFVLETIGWCKDMDYYTRDGETIAPLPTTGKPAQHRDYLHNKYNRRFEMNR